jgi:hypothetical protein
MAAARSRLLAVLAVVSERSAVEYAFQTIVNVAFTRLTRLVRCADARFGEELDRNLRACLGSSRYCVRPSADAPHSLCCSRATTL